MRRRDFIRAIAGSAAVGPLAARAQPAKPPIIAFVGSGTTSSQGQFGVAFAQRLRELGWDEGHTATIEYHWTEGRKDRAQEILAEIARRKPDVIVTVGSPAAAAARQATSVIPVVFVLVSDPIMIGIAANLARPGGNFTGFSNQSADTGTKRLGLLRDIVPNLHRLAIMFNVDNPGTVGEMREVQKAAAALDFATTKLELRREDDIIPAFSTIQGQVDAIYVCTDGLTISNRVRINTLALVAKLPTMHGNREDLEGGGLISYGASPLDLCRHAADDVDKILRGAKPAEIPIEEPTKFELVINMKSAKALGLNVPYSMQLLADEVIE